MSCYYDIANFALAWEARSKQCPIGPAITKLSAGDLFAGHAIQWG